MNSIEIKQITKQFGENTAVDAVSLNVAQGDFFGFIGPNGAGKTTTIKAMLNLLRLDDGSIKLLGRDISQNQWQAKIGYIPGEASLYDNLTVEAQIAYFARYYPRVDTKYLNHLTEVFRLPTKKKIADLSMGNKQKVSIVCALMPRPSLILADEASNGLDPLMQKTLFAELNELNKLGTTIFFSSHNLEEVQHYCRNVAIIKEGRIVAVDNLRKIIDGVGVSVSVKAIQPLTTFFKQAKIQPRVLADGSVQFMYQGEIDPLIKRLAKFELSYLRVNDVSLDELFAQYYQNEK